MSTPVPVPVPTIGNAEQTGVALLTYLAIKQAGSTNAQKLAAALTAKSVASVFSDFANGDATALNSEMAALLKGLTDPALKSIASSLLAYAQPFIDAEIAAVKGMPIIGLQIDAGLSAAAAGINQVADAYIAAYGPNPAA